MRKKVMAGNWKMNMQLSGLGAYFEQFASVLDEPPSSLPKFVDVVFAIPYTMLDAVKRLAEGVFCKVAAQNVHWAESGAFTGEISTSMLKEFGVNSTLVGHSERRQYFGERDETVAIRTRAALRAEMTPIVCIGETLEQRQQDKTEDVLKAQLMALRELFGEAKKMIIAYEPVWAIGTGQTATPEQAEEAHDFIRRFFRAETDAADVLPILYGGSAKASNISDLLAKPNIDGALVGGASLKPDEFAAMVNAAVINAKRQ